MCCRTRDFLVDSDLAVPLKGFGEILFHAGLRAGISSDLCACVGRAVAIGAELAGNFRVAGVNRDIVVAGFVKVS